ncbi:M20 family metallopeptidase [Neobacillus sp. Marseille-QA0830]
MLQKLYAKLEEYYEDMVSIRRYLHQHPELSFQEYETAQYIESFYKNLNIDVRGKVGGNGVVAKITGGKPGKTVALRADFDALPIQDEKEVPYKSLVPGVMHACGHDGHTASLLILAKALNELRPEIEGNIVFIHQHAEEFAPGGAIAMIKDGCLDGVDVIFGTHLWASELLGTIQYRTGPIMAAADRFEIDIQGQGGHGAQPHKTKDAIVTASQLVLNLQQIVSRKVNPVDSAVVTVASFMAPNAFNVIADKAKLVGTVRTFKEEVRSFIEQEMARIIHGTCYLSDSDYEFKYERGYPAVVNHDAETELLISCAKEVSEVNLIEESELQMGAEDFAYYLEKVPGTFFFTGAEPATANPGYPHHHPKFDINEKAMLIAAKTLGTSAIKFNNA